MVAMDKWFYAGTSLQIVACTSTRGTNRLKERGEKEGKKRLYYLDLQMCIQVTHTNVVLGDGHATTSGRKRGLVELAGMEVDYLYQAKKYRLEASKMYNPLVKRDWRTSSVAPSTSALRVHASSSTRTCCCCC